MANYVTISLSADNIEKYDFTKLTSFNSVEKMPECLERTASGSTSNYVDHNYNNGLKYLLENRKGDKILPIARSYRALQTEGYSNWYDWRMKKWGVKSDIDVDMIQYYPNENRVVFDVPWSLPIPFFEALTKKHPEVRFFIEFAEEQDGYWTGDLELYDGSIVKFNEDEEYSKEAYERYFSLCGGDESYEFNEEINNYVQIM